MRQRIIILFIVLIALSTVTAIFAGSWYRVRLHSGGTDSSLPAGEIRILRKALADRLALRTKGIKTYLEQHQFNTDFCLLADLGAASGIKRFFVYDVKGDSILYAAMVSHGRCNKDWLEGRRYSNVKGGGCSSLGKYRIGNKYYGQFGLAYKLYGLERTNSKAFERFVVLHSYDCVPAGEIYPAELCQSNGCPMLSPGMMALVGKKIDASKKPVLLWLYD